MGLTLTCLRMDLSFVNVVTCMLDGLRTNDLEALTFLCQMHGVISDMEAPEVLHTCSLIFRNDGSGALKDMCTSGVCSTLYPVTWMKKEGPQNVLFGLA